MFIKKNDIVKLIDISLHTERIETVVAMNVNIEKSDFHHLLRTYLQHSLLSEVNSLKL